MPVKQPHTARVTGALQTEIALCSAQRRKAPGLGEDMRRSFLLRYVRRREEAIQGCHSQSEGVSDVFRHILWVRAQNSGTTISLDPENHEGAT